MELHLAIYSISYRERERERERGCLYVCVVTVMIVPVVLYGCETWSLALRKERRLRVFENRELKKILGPKRD